MIFILLIVVNISSESTDRGFFPFGFYDEVQDKGCLSMSLNYGFLDQPGFYGNWTENGRVISSHSFSSIKINYGLFKWLTISPQLLSYRHDLAYMSTPEFDDEDEALLLSLNVDLLISYSKRFYSIIDTLFLIGDKYFHHYMIFGHGLNLGMIIYENDKILLNLALDFGWPIGDRHSVYLGYRCKKSDFLNVSADLRYSLNVSNPGEWIFCSVNCSMNIFDGWQFNLGICYSMITSRGIGDVFPTVSFVWRMK